VGETEGVGEIEGSGVAGKMSTGVPLSAAPTSHEFSAFRLTWTISVDVICPVASANLNLIGTERPFWTIIGDFDLVEGRTQDPAVAAGVEPVFLSFPDFFSALAIEVEVTKKDRAKRIAADFLSFKHFIRGPRSVFLNNEVYLI